LSIHRPFSSEKNSSDVSLEQLLATNKIDSVLYAQIKKAEAEMKKSEPEMKKSEAEMKKSQAEAEMKKSEAEIKKSEAEIKKSEAEMKKNEAEKKKAEVELQKIKESRSIVQSSWRLLPFVYRLFYFNTSSPMALHNSIIKFYGKQLKQNFQIPNKLALEPSQLERRDRDDDLKYIYTTFSERRSKRSAQEHQIDYQTL